MCYAGTTPKYTVSKRTVGYCMGYCPITLVKLSVRLLHSAIAGTNDMLLADFLVYCWMRHRVDKGGYGVRMLFLLHINDLPDCVSSRVSLFADDCLLYRPIYETSDQHALQKDLDSLAVWCDRWGMSFNAAKCEVMRISRKKTVL